MQLYLQCHADKIRAGNSGAVDVASITQRTLVEVALVLVEDILNSGTEFEAVVLVQMYIVSKPQPEIPERGCKHLFVQRYESCQVRHEHRAGSPGVERDSKILDRLDIEEQVAVVVRRA